jgi:hypothetical protein
VEVESVPPSGPPRSWFSALGWVEVPTTNDASVWSSKFGMARAASAFTMWLKGMMKVRK